MLDICGCSLYFFGLVKIVQRLMFVNMPMRTLPERFALG